MNEIDETLKEDSSPIEDDKPKRKSKKKPIASVKVTAYFTLEHLINSKTHIPKDFLTQLDQFDSERIELMLEKGIIKRVDSVTLDDTPILEGYRHLLTVNGYVDAVAVYYADDNILIDLLDIPIARVTYIKSELFAQLLRKIRG
jgi:hypothetical protein